MAFSDEQLSRIYDRTNGRCHICRRQLSFSKYGRHGQNGAWHVEHSRPRSLGGTDHGNNLYAACIPCNLAKGTFHTRTARGWHGNTRAPYSAVRLKAKRETNTAGGALIGAGLGLLLGGPIGALVVGFLGGAIGNDSSPNL